MLFPSFHTWCLRIFLLFSLFFLTLRSCPNIYVYPPHLKRCITWNKYSVPKSLNSFAKVRCLPGCLWSSLQGLAGHFIWLFLSRMPFCPNLGSTVSIHCFFDLSICFAGSSGNPVSHVENWAFTCVTTFKLNWSLLYQILFQENKSFRRSLEAPNSMYCLFLTVFEKLFMWWE